MPLAPGGPPPAWSEELHLLALELRCILEEARLQPRFQPILDLRDGRLHGFEGLIRGPVDSVLHGPANLFQVAALTGQTVALEAACWRTLARAFAETGQEQRLFLNVSPGSLGQPAFQALLEGGLGGLGLEPGRIVIELTESQPTPSFAPLLGSAARCRELGYALAMDDVGEGYSSLRLWSELRPEYVKIDLHFVQGAAQDPLKLQFLRSLRDIAGRSGAQLVAEGIETEADLAVIRDLGLEHGQGFLLGRPEPVPSPGRPAGLLSPADPVEGSAWLQESRSTASRLMLDVAPLPPEASNAAVETRFTRDRELQSIPVVKDGIPVGLIHRHAFLDLMGRPFSRELYGKRACEGQMDRCILVLDQQTGLHELSKLIVESDPRHILHGFILTRQGRYAGMGSGHDLMREITRMQINAARYSNPLTGLPGNVPINEHLDGLLRQGAAFVACYCDLDHFKPYNDVYGYRRGDDAIQWLGRLLEAVCEPDLDFVGHIGGDDFMLVFRSLDWERRCRELLASVEAGRGRFFSAGDLARGGYPSEDRQARMVFHPLLSLSIGAVQAPPGAFASHHELAAAAATAKKEAKRQEGCSLFLERRAGTVPGR